MTFRIYLTGTIFVTLLIWGAIDNSWPFWLIIRTGYLFIIPALVWLLLSWIWNYFQPNNNVEIILERILSGVICIALFTFATLEAISNTHIGNTQTIRTRDGVEAVGDDIVLRGPNYGNVFILTVIALLVLWFGVLKKGAEVSVSKTTK